jgi:hypothetical protein
MSSKGLDLEISFGEVNTTHYHDYKVRSQNTWVSILVYDYGYTLRSFAIY